MDAKNIHALFDELLEKYKQARLIVIMEDASKNHELLKSLDKEIESYRERLKEFFK